MIKVSAVHLNTATKLAAGRCQNSQAGTPALRSAAVPAASSRGGPAPYPLSSGIGLGVLTARFSRPPFLWGRGLFDGGWGMAWPHRAGGGVNGLTGGLGAVFVDHPHAIEIFERTFARSGPFGSG
jgi:hypothetical protein